MIFNHIWNYLMLKWKRVHCGKNLTIYGRLHLHGPKGHISIGEDCVIISATDYNPTAGGTNTQLVTGGNGTLKIGNNVGMSLVCITARSSVVIEDNVLIGACTKIWDTDFHPVDYSKRMRKEMGDTKPIIIGEGAFLGACTIVLKGVTIGEHSVVGAGSVVTRSIPPYEIWAGNPAKFIKKVED